MTLPKGYPAHMLRINPTHSATGQDKKAFLVTLENTETAVRINFSDFQSLSEYLQTQVQTQAAL